MDSECGGLCVQFSSLRDSTDRMIGRVTLVYLLSSYVVKIARNQPGTLSLCLEPANDIGLYSEMVAGLLSVPGAREGSYLGCVDRVAR